MNLFDKIKKFYKSKYFVPVIFILGLLSLPYITIPSAILWWLYKTNRISKKTLLIIIFIPVSLFVLIVLFALRGYIKDVEPTLALTTPTKITTEENSISIEGKYTPSDRKVWINDKLIESSDGKFVTSVDLKDGENIIKVSAGDFKRTDEKIIVNKNPKPTEISVISIPSNTSTPIPEVTQIADEYYVIAKVVDGDTYKVTKNGKSETVRLIGINTPETVDPRKPVECFGKEASEIAKSMFTNKKVKLENDASQGDRDKYDRLLRYFITEKGTDVGLWLIQEGYAYEYTYNLPYKYQKKYKDALITAENSKKGLWADNECVTTTQTPQPTSKYVVPTNPPAKQQQNNIAQPQNNNSSNVSCSTNCSELTCEQAYQLLNAGCGSKDADKDGIPCENICPGG